MYGQHLLIAEYNNMDQPRKVAKPARGQLNREIECPLADASVVMYCCLHFFIDQVYFLIGDMYILRARFTAVYAYMCNYKQCHLHTQAESGPYYLRDSSRVPRRRPYIYLFKEKIRTHLDLLSIPRLWGKKCQNV